ncbi:hypothetical protein MIMGU_mgv11b021138mg [Erythranthe guttata]|uniref:NB-ARC domain-containing protein n=1 Tax=Erythranthe guttata TaxID=4155 RepID=A0A022QFI5_ERYGU|nr:hypothetical protein MIMGU_mgv11b021138mg [Erythranthe guttata]
MKKMTAWGMSVVSGESRFPNLRILEINNCHTLKDLSMLTSTKLECLTILQCPKILSLPIDGLPKYLKELVISGRDKLKHSCSVGERDYKQIEWVEKIIIDHQPLHIIKSPSMKNIVKQDFEDRNRVIHLMGCTKNSVLNDLGILRHLKLLVIEDMPMLDTVSSRFSGLQCLESLKIVKMKKMNAWGMSVVFGESRFPNLCILEINNCHMLKELPVLTGTKLECLTILQCPKILSSSIDGLP